MSLRLSLFGAPTVTFGATSMALEFERRTQLVAYLALKRTWVSRSELAALLWPDQDTKLAQTNLRKALFRLSFPALGRSDRSAGWRAAFRAPHRRAVVRNGAARATPRRRARRMRAATCWPDSTTIATRPGRAGSRSSATGCAQRGARRRRSISPATLDAGGAIDLAARLLEADPLDEAALRALHDVARASRPGRACAAGLPGLRRSASRRTRARPGCGAAALHDTIGAVAARRSPRAVRRLAARTTASSAAPSSCGASRRCSAQDDCRLLRVIGPGGVGKTRLARRALAELGAVVRRRRGLRPAGGRAIGDGARRAGSRASWDSR